MGGRYGGSDDGSDEYQSRQPQDDDLSEEQQTVADAVQSVADRYHDDSEGHSEEPTENTHDTSNSDTDGGSQRGSDSSDTDGQHPLTAFGGQRSVNSGLDTLADIDDALG